MLIVYNLILYLLTPFLVAALLVRSIRLPEYRQRIAERFGVLPAHIGTDYIWLHSVSVGETLAAAPLVAALQSKYPDKRLLITTMTPTGSQQVQRSFGDTVDHVYAPYDLPGSVKRFLTRARPCIAVIMETELWPNTLKHCDKMNVPTVLLNARLSESSAKGYAKVAGSMRQMLQQLDAVAVQSDADGQRFVSLGLAAEKLSVTGSVKFDYSIEPAAEYKLAQLTAEWPDNRFVWIAASTHQGEDDILLDAQQLLIKRSVQSLLILVPRHPERFDDVYRLCNQRGLRVIRRSAQQAVADNTDILLGDTMGELATLFGAGKIAYIGGSLIERGGHNPIEPAAWGLPVIAGPHMFNFLDITRQLLDGKGLITVHNATDIADQVQACQQSPQWYEQAGKANRDVVASNRGAAQRQIAVVARLLSNE